MNHRTFLQAAKSSPLSAGSLEQWGQAVCNRYRIDCNTQSKSLASEQANDIWRWDHLNPEYQGFTYEINSLGFRDKEFDTGAECAYFGCSITYGEGVPADRRWTSLVDQAQGWRSNNLAVRGMALDELTTLLISSIQYMPELKYVIVLAPPVIRQNIPFTLSDGSVEFHLINPHSNTPINLDKKLIQEIQDFRRNYYSLNDEYFYDRFDQEIWTIKKICDLKGIKLIITTWAMSNITFTECYKHAMHIPDGEISVIIANDKTGRDFSHPGPAAHEQLAEAYNQCIEQVKTNTNK
jgi:hypothetical protein